MSERPPPCCPHVAAGHAVFDFIEEEKLAARAVALGDRLTARPQALRARCPAPLLHHGKIALYAPPPPVHPHQPLN